MIIYNVTINVDEGVHLEWLDWMKNFHIPDVMKTGLFTESRMLRVLGEEESGGFTYSVQYYCENMEIFRQYEREHAARLRGDALNKFKDRFVSFRTLLETVS